MNTVSFIEKSMKKFRLEFYQDFKYSFRVSFRGRGEHSPPALPPLEIFVKKINSSI